MIEVYPRLWVGDDNDASNVISHAQQNTKGMGLTLAPWAMVSAAKEPYHRALVGYTGRGAPKDSPEYYSARRGRHLALNWVDVDDPGFFRAREVYEAHVHIQAAQHMEIDCLVHCNQGVSRSPALALSWLHIYGGDEWVLGFEEAEEKFRGVYPPYDPTSGVREFIKELVW